MSVPEVVPREEWLAARKALLAKEKELTRATDGVNAARRRLPMTRVGKDYQLDGLRGAARLPDLSAGNGSWPSITSCSGRTGKPAAQAAPPPWTRSRQA